MSIGIRSFTLQRKCEKHHTVVIGGGVAGLTAAKTLLQYGIEVTLLEAGSRLGGRVRPEPIFSGCPDLFVELGGEFIHGGHTGYYDLVQENGWEHEYAYHWFPDRMDMQDQIYLTNNRAPQAFSMDHTITYLDSQNRTFNEIKNAFKSAKGDSLDEILANCSKDTRLIAETIFCQTDGVDTLDDYPHYKITDALKCVSDISTSSNYRLLDSTDCVLKHFKHSIEKARVMLNSPVYEIDYSKGNITVKYCKGDEIRCDSVIIAVPITILQQKSIKFVPALSVAKRKAIQAVNTTAASKVLMRFSKKIWGRENIIVCGNNRFCSQIWFKEYHIKDSLYYIVTGFCTGKLSHAMECFHERECVRAFLLQLDQLFSGCKDYFLEGHAIHWNKAKGISLGYSAFAKPGVREELINPIRNKLYFAGEATSLTDFGTIGGAIDSGKSVAESHAKWLGATLNECELCQKPR